MVLVSDSVELQLVIVRIERGNHIIELKQIFPAWVTATSDVAGVAYEIAVNINEQMLKMDKT